MSIRTILIIALALMSGLAAALGIKSLPLQTAAQQEPVKDKVAIVVAAGNIPRGVCLAPENMRLQEFPKDLVPEGALTKIDDAVDRVAMGPLVKGEFIPEGKLSERGVGGGLSPIIKPGRRGYNIQLRDFSSAVAGFIMPGNHVDVILTMEVEIGTPVKNPKTGEIEFTKGAPMLNMKTGKLEMIEDKEGKMTTKMKLTKTILENVEVITIRQHMEAPRENRASEAEATSVTVEVTPHQAHLLEVAQTQGPLRLMLRGPKDVDAAEATPVSEYDLLRQRPSWIEAFRDMVQSLPKPPPPAPKPAEPTKVVEVPKPVAPPRPTHKMTIMNGDKPTQHEFPLDKPLQAKPLESATKDRKPDTAAPAPPGKEATTPQPDKK